MLLPKRFVKIIKLGLLRLLQSEFLTSLKSTMKTITFSILALLFVQVIHAQQTADLGTITIVKATYAGGDVQKDVTALVSEKVQDGRLNLRVGNDLLGGDPSFGKVKSLTVLYSVNGREYSLTKSEGSTLVIPSPETVPLTLNQPVASPIVVSTATVASTPTPTPPKLNIQLPLEGQNFVTLDGQQFTNTTVKKVDPDGIVVMDADGVRKLKFQKLQPDVQAKYGYDENEAIAFQRQSHNDAIARQNAAIQLQKKRELEETEKTKDKNALFISGTVDQSTSVGTFLYLEHGQKIFVQGLIGKADGSHEGCYAYQDGLYEIRQPILQNGSPLTERIEKWVFVPNNKVPIEVRSSPGYIPSRPGSLRSVGGG